MPLPAKDETEVTKWLNGFKDFGADEFIDKFYNAGCYEISNLDAETVDRIVKKPKPGLANKLKDSLKELLAAPKKPAPVPLPPLPPRTPLDVSGPTAKLPDGKDFVAIPSEPSTQQSATPIDSPEELTPADWMFLARKTKMLFGFLVDGADPARAPKPVLRWIVPDGDFFTDETGRSGVDSSVSYTETTTKYVRAGFDSESASLGYAFCSASADREHKEKEARTSSTQTLHMVANYRYPRATVTLSDCTVVAPEFVEQVGKAMASNDPEASLAAVLQTYGHVTPTTVQLGGKLRSEKTQTVTGSEHVRETEDTFRAAMSIKAGPAEAAVSGTKQDASSQTEEAQSLSQNLRFDATGGDTSLNINPAAWAPTVHKAKLWDVIGYGKMQSTVELLPEPLRAQVKAVWYKHHPPVAFEEGEEQPWQAGPALTFPLRRDGFVSLTRQALADGDWGSALIVSGPGDDPGEDEPATASGAAFVQKSVGRNIWLECNSVCLPVNADLTCSVKFNNAGGAPAGRFTFHPAKLRFGNWMPAFGKGSPRVTKEMPDADLSATAASDGFLFVAVQAAGFGQMGGVEGLINGQAVAGSYVHWTESSEPYPQQGFCIPVPAKSKYSIQRDFPMGAPVVRAFWMAITSAEWSLRPAVTRHTNTPITAGENGILHGRIRINNDRQKGALRVYVGRDADAAAPTAQPYVAASVQMDQQAGRLVPCNSVMLPVAVGARYQAVHQPSPQALPVDLFWTPVVPA